jgi:hypothetical protein
MEAVSAEVAHVPSPASTESSSGTVSTIVGSAGVATVALSNSAAGGSNVIWSTLHFGQLPRTDVRALRHHQIDNPVTGAPWFITERSVLRILETMNCLWATVRLRAGVLAGTSILASRTIVRAGQNHSEDHCEMAVMHTYTARS